MIRGLAGLGLAAALLAALGSAGTAQDFFTITSFRSDIFVRADARVTVAETIDLDFGDVAKHGILRNIPVRYKYAKDKDRVYRLESSAVTNGSGQQWPYTVNEDGAYLVFKIGDPDRTVTGKQTYRITYTLRGVLNSFTAENELFWNVNGPEWEVPILRTSASVRVEGGQLPTRVTCFQGFTSSADPCAQAARTTTGAEFAAHGAFSPGEQLTIVAGIPKGATAEPAVILEGRPRDIEDWWETTPAIVAATLLVLLAAIGQLARTWWRGGRDERVRGEHVVVAEYDPPDDLRPAEMGLILDESVDAQDLGATILDLAVRGYIHVEEHEPKGIFTKRDWTLKRVRPADDAVTPWESKLLDGLFAKGEEVKVSALPTSFAERRAEAKQLLYRSAVKSGWFPRDPSSVRTAWAAGGFALAVVGGVVTVLLGMALGASLVGLAVVVAGAIVIAVSGIMPKRSAKGRELLQRIRGLRRYMDTAEADRSRFAEREGIFMRLLPYALVFGIVDRWARAFEGTAQAAAASSWYAGNPAFFAGSFAGGDPFSAFSSGLSSSVASTTASSGGSGFGGGGFSGGGGGGGGGGSW